jgi:hypothetical protein
VFKSRAVVTALSVGTIVGGAVAVPFGASAQTPGCTAANNVEAIIDDSGSMNSTDPNRLRKSGMDLLLNKPSNDNKTFGAVEFGTDAAALFGPDVVAANRASFLQMLDQRIQANDGSTDYNDAFNLAKTHNPNAQARIFLTDGAHNAGAYQNGHQGGPRTYVVGLGNFQAQPDDAARLQQIANETGGKYFAQQDASSLQSTMNQIDSLIACRQITITKQVVINGVGTDTLGNRLSRSTLSLGIELSHPNAGNKVGLSEIQQVMRGRVVARWRASGAIATTSRVKKLRVTRRLGSTFQVLRVRGLLRGGGRLRYKVRTTTFVAQETATLQLTPSRSR